VRITAVSDRALVRLIPATYHKPPALRGLVDSDDEMAVLAEIEGLTSARLKAEQGRNARLDIRDLAWARRKNDLRYGATIWMRERDDLDEKVWGRGSEMMDFD
jgi:hypothetical protein